jgi:predicted DNA-binding transcriptional regulator AlpA
MAKLTKPRMSSVTPGYWNVHEVATYLSIAVSTVWSWVKKDLLPEPERLGRRITRWRVADLLDFLDKNKETSSTEI